MLSLWKYLCERHLKSDGLLWKVNGHSRVCWFSFNEEKNTISKRSRWLCGHQEKGQAKKENCLLAVRACENIQWDVGYGCRF